MYLLSLFCLYKASLLFGEGIKKFPVIRNSLCPFSLVKIVIDKDFVLNRVALFDTGADSNCVVKGLIPTKYLQKSKSRLYSATGEKMTINYELPKAHICNNGICLVNDFVISEDITEDIILGIPFVNQIRPYQSDYDGIRSILLGARSDGGCNAANLLGFRD